MKRKSGLLWLVLLLSFSSCVSYERLSIEVVKPAKLTLSPNIRKLAMVARNLKYVNDTLQNYQVKDGKLVKDRIRFNCDSAAITSCLDSLSGKLLAQVRFDSILILPVSFFPETRVKDVRPNKISWYSKLADNTGADGLILLDMFSCFYIESNENNNAKVITSDIWSFYDNKQQKIVDRFAQTDTLFWEGNDENGNLEKIRIPEKQMAIPIAAGVIGSNYAKHIQPSWTLVYREIMTSNHPEFKIATTLARKGKWDEASAIWQKYIDSKNRQNKIISLYNLALANEMSGNMDQAIHLIGQSAAASSGIFGSTKNDAIRKYSAILYQRKIEINQLNTQK